jgi:type II secretory pathway pseudopilin PulG
VRRDPRLLRNASGLVLLGVLLLLALGSLAALAGAEVWATAMRRDQEEQLLYAGEQYRRAIESYWRATPGRVKTLPNSLAVLLQDDRFPMPVRHLRRLYVDPLDAQADWGLVKVDSGIAGVYSTSTAIPLKRRGFPARYAHFEDAKDYRQWRFVLNVPGRPGQPIVPRTPESQDRR